MSDRFPGLWLLCGNAMFADAQRERSLFRQSALAALSLWRSGSRRRFTPAEEGVTAKADEWRYYGTSVPAERAEPQVLADAIRKHWQIENCLHYRKDHTMDEDRHVLRTRRAPTNLSHLRSIVAGLLSCIEIDDLPAQTHPQKMAYLGSNLDGVADPLHKRWRIK